MKRLFFLVILPTLLLLIFGCNQNKPPKPPKPLKTFTSPEISEGDNGSYKVSVAFYKDKSWVCNIASGTEKGFPLLRGTYTGDILQDTGNENHVKMTLPAKTDPNDKSDAAKVFALAQTHYSPAPKAKSKNSKSKNPSKQESKGSTKEGDALSWGEDYTETIIIKNGDIDWDYFWLFYKDKEKKGFLDKIGDFFGNLFK